MEFSFNDSNGKAWPISMTIGRARRSVLKKTGIDFLDGNPEEIINKMILERTVFVDLIWLMLDDRGDYSNDEQGQEKFENKVLDVPTYRLAKLEVDKVIENFIQTTRPEIVPLWEKAIPLMTTQVTESVANVISLLDSTEVQNAFSSANANVKKDLLNRIEKEFSKPLGHSD